jgi:ABC-type phosphate/phosphonate transport system substrate-binding protein
VLKYGGLADAIGKALKADVKVVFVREFAQLEDGMKTGRLDLVMARPSDYPARGLRDHGYQYIATVKPEGQCLIVVAKDSPIKQLADLKGRKIVMPEKAAYMSKFCRAELRNQGIDLDKEAVTYVREQEAVAFYINNGFNQAGGLASYSGAARNWIKEGGTVLHRSVPQPYSPLIGSKALSATEVSAVQKAVLALSDTPEGREVLKTAGMSGGFDTGTEPKVRELLKFLGE